MNTLLKVKVKVKDEYIKMIKDLLSLINSEKDEDFYIWKSLYRKYKFDWIKDYSELEKADYIPFGIISEEYNDWCKDPELNELREGNWTFVCELRNENNEIEKFIFNILSNIVADNESNHILTKCKSTGITYIYNIKNTVVIRSVMQ